MKIHIFLDESGNLKSTSFCVGGFYFVQNTNIDKVNIKANIKNKIKKNIISIEQHILDNNLLNEKYANEIKWNTLTYAGKKYFFENIKNHKQKNVCMIADLINWRSKQSKNMDCIYNILVKWLIEKIIKEIDDQIEDNTIDIVLNIDQRKNVPSVKNGIVVGLQEYLNTYFYENNSKNIKIIVIQHNSINNWCIRYCDCFVGMIASLCRMCNKEDKIYDIDVDLIFDHCIANVPTRIWSKYGDEKYNKICQIYNSKK